MDSHTAVEHSLCPGRNDPRRGRSVCTAGLSRSLSEKSAIGTRSERLPAIKIVIVRSHFSGHSRKTPLNPGGSPLPDTRTGQLDTQPGCTSVNASSRRLPDDTYHSRPRRLARSYLVRLLHSLLSSGFSPTHLDPFISSGKMQLYRS